MSTGNRLLVVVDPTVQDQPDVSRAAWLAERIGAGLELFICYYDQYLSGERFFDSPGLRKARREALDTQRTYLEKLAAPLSERGLDVVIDAVWDTPLHEGIVRKALATRPRLIVKDTHYHNALKRSVFSNTDWNLIRTSPLPLYLVKPHAISATPKVLAAVDPVHEHDKPAALDHLIVQQAEELADGLGGELHLFHGYDPMPAIAGAATTIATPISVPVDAITEEMETAHGKALKDLAATYEVPDGRVHMHRGAARDMLPAVADELGADIVVMGAVARSALRRAFIGSTAEQTLDRLGCDVIVVKPDDFDTPVRMEDAADYQGRATGD
jgi:universal stress protein E